MRLWEVCQTPDFRKTTQDEHTRLIGTMFEHLTQRDRRLPEDWMQGQFASLDRLEGDIDALSARLARVRTLAYVANRGDWLADPAGLAGARPRARGPALRHAARMPDAALHRPAHQRAAATRLSQRAGPILGGIGADGAVTVEGHLVGTLAGVAFEPERGASALENRALRGAVERAVAPEIARRLGELASEGDEAFALAADGVVLWRGQRGGRDRRRPAVLAARALGRRIRRRRRRASAPTRRLEAYVAAESSRRLFVLEAAESGGRRRAAQGPGARPRLSAGRAVRRRSTAGKRRRSFAR